MPVVEREEGGGGREGNESWAVVRSPGDRFQHYIYRAVYLYSRKETPWRSALQSGAGERRTWSGISREKR